MIRIRWLKCDGSASLILVASTTFMGASGLYEETILNIVFESDLMKLGSLIHIKG